MQELAKVQKEFRQVNGLMRLSSVVLALLSLMSIGLCFLIITMPGPAERPAMAMFLAIGIFLGTIGAAGFAFVSVRKSDPPATTFIAALLATVLYAAGTLVKYGRLDTMLLVSAYFCGTTLYWEYVRRAKERLEGGTVVPQG